MERTSISRLRAIEYCDEVHVSDEYAVLSRTHDSIFYQVWVVPVNWRDLGSRIPLIAFYEGTNR